jgi:hypothetical protein
MKNLIQATILIMSVLFSNASSTTDVVISGAAGYSYISLDKSIPSFAETSNWKQQETVLVI